MKKPEHPIIDPSSTIVIERTYPGFIITRYEEYADTVGTYFPVRYPIQEDEKFGGSVQHDLNAVADMLWRVLDILYIHNSKHAKHRINIEVVEQD